MILFKKEDRIIVRVDYSPEIVQKLKQIPGASFDNWEWTMPVSSWPIAYEMLGVHPAHLYPYLREYVPAGLLPSVKAHHTGQALILTGNDRHLDYLITNLTVLCGFEEVSEEYKPGKGRVYTRNQQTLLEIKEVRQNSVTVAYPQGLHHRVKTFVSEWLDIPFKDTQAVQIPKPILKFPGQPKYAARYYQENIAAQAPFVRRATIVKPTGSGKTRTAGEIIRKTGLPTVFLTDSKLLLKQTAKSLGETLNIPIGMIGDGLFDVQPVTVATIQTIFSILKNEDNILETKALQNEIVSVKALLKGLEIPESIGDKRDAVIKMLAGCDLLIVDEAHTLGADIIYQVASLAQPAMSFGLTATYQREDERGIYIEAATGPIWKPVNEQELMDQGYLLPVKVLVLPFNHGRKYEGRLRDMQKIKRLAIIDNNQRNQLLQQVCKHYGSKYKTLLLVNEQEHAAKLAQALTTKFITGKTPSKEQEQAIKDLREGKINALVATPLLEQGVDIPESQLLIDGVPRRSVRRIIQAAGRIRRPSPGKDCAYIVTIMDIDGGMFEKQSLRKLHILKQAGFEVHILTNQTRQNTQRSN